VQDHGPGIPDSEREAVFDRFHRLDSRDSREIYGHGLGLYLSRQLLLAMSGGIRVGKSAEGTRVEFWLPVAKETQSHSASA
jgi:signal transduction histidine kinase